MRYVLFVCSDGIRASDQEEDLCERAIGEFVAGTSDRRLFGQPLLGPETATTVRVSDGQTLLSDGPFVETKEHLAGFDVVECETREAAIALAASHPLAWFHRIEVRPCAVDGGDEWTAEVRERLRRGPKAGTGRYLLLICVESPSGLHHQPARSVADWVNEQSASGARIVGQVLERVESAVTVRVRGPHTLVTDGPYVESKEWIAGFDVIECTDLDRAVAIAAAHPIASTQMIEIRPFSDSHGVRG